MAALEFAGLAAAASTFGGVWIGHVAVRAIEYRARRLWLPASLFVAVGCAFEALALASSSLALSAAAGVLGMTFIYDAIELRRQWKRVMAGRARANPANPRHRDALGEARAEALGGDKAAPR